MQVGFEINGGVALITMDDGKKNAITPTATQEILAALEDAEANASALVLAGRPGAFCAGFDLATMTSGDKESIASLATGGARILLKLYSMGMPLVAAGTGHAFTIGALWLLACDTRIGERGNYKFGMNETVMGMVLPDWALEVLKARVNPMFFLPVVTQAVTLCPEEAVQAGFLDKVVDEGRALEIAQSTAAQLAQLPADAYAGNKLTSRKQALELMSTSLSKGAL
jgi:enoyl-CoA hydratase